jgi:hypothetical protein
MKGTLDLPPLQTLRLVIPRTKIAAPGAMPKNKLSKFLHMRNPITPAASRNPPIGNKYTRTFRI